MRYRYVQEVLKWIRVQTSQWRSSREDYLVSLDSLSIIDDFI